MMASNKDDPRQIPQGKICHKCCGEGITMAGTCQTCNGTGRITKSEKS
jgi:DnaJ-class molecular chaperone